MNDKPDGGPAFPNSAPRPLPEFSGMSLRDYFAGQALVGLIAAGYPEAIPERAYKFADTMLKARGQ